MDRHVVVVEDAEEAVDSSHVKRATAAAAVDLDDIAGTAVVVAYPGEMEVAFGSADLWACLDKRPGREEAIADLLEAEVVRKEGVMVEKGRMHRRNQVG